MESRSCQREKTKLTQRAWDWGDRNVLYFKCVGGHVCTQFWSKQASNALSWSSKWKRFPDSDKRSKRLSARILICSLTFTVRYLKNSHQSYSQMWSCRVLCTVVGVTCQHLPRICCTLSACCDILSNFQVIFFSFFSLDFSSAPNLRSLFPSNTISESRVTWRLT